MKRTLACCVASLGLGTANAEAGIVCNEGYQRVNGQEISTPYCNDNYVAEVARLYGFKVSNAAVRNSPALKDKICRELGSDIRIAPYCNTDSGPDRSW